MSSHRIPAALLAAVTLTSCNSSRSVSPPIPSSDLPRYVVALGEGASQEELVKAIEAAGGHVTTNMEAMGVVEVQADPAFLQRAQEISNVGSVALSRRRLRLERMRAASGVASGDLSFDLPPKPGPGDDPLTGYQWDLPVGKVPDAWQSGFKGRGTVVAVLDSGVDPDNPDLRPNLDLAHARSFVPNEPDIVDRHGHGSHVAGTIAAARNGAGTIGVAPEATILPVKVLDSSGWGDDFGIIKGIDYAVGQGASIINMSLTGLFDRSPEGNNLRNAYTRAIRYAQSRGAIVVVCAGNDGLQVPDSNQYVLPAQAGDAIVVGAIGPFDGQEPLSFAPYSNYGTGFLSLAAPGGGMGFDPETFTPIVHKTDLILSTWSTHAIPHEDLGFRFGPATHMFLGGTSMAAAYVSGVAALARSAQGPLRPTLLKGILLNSAVPMPDQARYGRGMVDAAKATQRP